MPSFRISEQPYWTFFLPDSITMVTIQTALRGAERRMLQGQFH